MKKNHRMFKNKNLLLLELYLHTNYQQVRERYMVESFFQIIIVLSIMTVARNLLYQSLFSLYKNDWFVICIFFKPLLIYIFILSYDFVAMVLQSRFYKTDFLISTDFH